MRDLEFDRGRKFFSISSLKEPRIFRDEGRIRDRINHCECFFILFAGFEDDLRIRPIDALGR